MRKFALKIFGFFPILLLVILINWKIDPANIYQKEYEGNAANILISGQNIVGMNNYDERIFQEKIIEKSKKCPDTIILGSSRIMTLSSDAIEIENYWNHGMSGAGLFDYIGILGIYKKYGKMPKKIIIGVDPWILNDENGDTRYQSIMLYINEFKMLFNNKDKASFKIPSFDKELQLLSLSYFQSSIEFIIKTSNGKRCDYYGTLEKDGHENRIRYIDGSIEYEKNIREISVEKVNNLAKSYIAGEIYQIENYKELSKKNSLMFEKMVEYLQENGIQICFYLSPYHPLVYNYLKENKDYQMVLQAEDYFRDIAKKRKIQVYGSYDPFLLECEENDFQDGMHLKRSSMSKSWKNVL